MVNAESNLLFSCFGYKLPTIEEIFGLKKPFPKMIINNAIHINIFALPILVSKVEALINNKNCPIAISVPPNIMLYLFPMYLSEINPPISGVK